MQTRDRMDIEEFERQLRRDDIIDVSIFTASAAIILGCLYLVTALCLTQF